jgi:lipid-A-disaccharide synthase-like uncharacterized protein
MNEILFTISGHTITSWQIVGILGTLLFSARWIVQVLHSHKHGKPVVPITFWYMSISGNILILAYFIFGRPDVVGITSNLFPLFIAFYNLSLLFKKKKVTT